MMVGGFAAVMPKGTKKENDAWKFIRFLGGPEGQRIYCTTSWQTPSIKRLFNDNFIQKEKNLRIYDKVMDECGWYRPITPVNSQMWDLINGEMWNSLINRKKGPSELLSWAEREINGHLARYNKK
jgi:ABC-type glycerol-3-phosphate transport system substrate-binding protein